MRDNVVFFANNGFLSKSDEVKIGCEECQNRKIMIDSAIEEYCYPSNHTSVYLSIKCPRSPSTDCRFNVYASPEYLACDTKFAERFQRLNMWLAKFCGDIHSAPINDRTKVVDDYFNQIVSEINFANGAEAGVEELFFALTWNKATENGRPFLVLAKELIFAKTYEYEILNMF